jgi:sugar phosphate isomerase/epimerase
METHDHWCRPSDVIEVINRADHPAIAVNWDVMHPVNREGVSVEDSFEILKGKIRHVHFHDGARVDGKVKLAPIGGGIVDHAKVVKLLKNSGYTDFLSGEWIGWEPYDIHLPRELATMRRYENEA